MPSDENDARYVCENCHRSGPMGEFQDDCRPGWTHGRLLRIKTTPEAALNSYHEFAFFEAANKHLPWMDAAGVNRALTYVWDRHLTQRDRNAAGIDNVAKAVRRGLNRDAVRWGLHDVLCRVLGRDRYA